MPPTPSLSIVIPIYNEPAWIGRVVNDARAAIRAAPFSPVEFVIVDDGSDEPTRQVLDGIAAGDPTVRVVRQENAGRFAARRRGIEEARGELVLLLDSRVSLRPDALRFVADALEADPAKRIWNAHVDVELSGNPYARFWNVLTEVAFRDYFEDPRTTSYGLEEFDRYPKGTTCFIAPRADLLDAIASFSSHYPDVRHANDDTLLIRNLASRHRVNISPGFSCVYRGRNALRPFLRHTRHRGVVFVDGFLRPGSRFLLPLLAFYPATLVAAAGALRRPRATLRLLPLVPAAWAAFAVGFRRGPKDVATMAVLGPPWMVAYGIGLWRGGLAVLRNWIRRQWRKATQP